MEIKVKNCGNCIFRYSDFDPNSMGNDTVDMCILLRNHFIDKNYFIDSYNSYDENGDYNESNKLNKTLDNCPLLKEEINVKYEN